MNKNDSLPFFWIVFFSLLLALFPSPLYASTPLVKGIPTQGTPFDGKLARTGIFDLYPESPELSHHSGMEELFAKARAFRYSKDRGADHWQTPQETAQKRSGDCEDKAVWLYTQLRLDGVENIRLVIGKYKSIDRNYHVWVQVEDPGGATLILDPAAQKRIWKSGDFSGGFYNALYSYDGKNRFKHYQQ